MERMQLGEEVTTDFVQNLLVDMIAFWNDQVAKLSEEVQSNFGPRILEDCDRRIESGMSEAKIAEIQNNAKDELERMLLSVEDSLKADAWSLSKLAGYKEGKILVWAWVSRGLVTMQQVAEWRFGGDVGQAKEFLDSTPHELAKLTELEEIEEPDAPAETKAVVQAETSTMQGEINSLWAISDPDLPEHPPKLLPQWFVPPIDRAILMWKQEAMVWEQRKQKKMSPKMTEAYAQWQSDSTRSIVLNKKTKSQMHRFLGKSVSSLKRTCLLLVVHMSNQPEELRINAGSGKAWRLSLLQGTMPPSDDAVPPELDHFQGKLPPEQDPVSDVENDEAAAADIQQMQMVADSDHEGEDLHPDMVPYMFVRPYIGDDEGRSGLCSEQSSLGSGTFADLFGCADLCRQTARCSFLTYWKVSQECRIYKECFWELCSNDYCFQASTYRNEPLGDYLTLRGYVQEFIVFPRRTLQTNFDDCKSCLHLYDHVHCHSARS
eukprot:g11370.t1